MDLKEFQEIDIMRLEKIPAAAFFWGMGTGKTLAGVERDRRLRAQSSPQGATLVIAPLSVHEHWKRHFREHTDYLRAITIGEVAQREDFLEWIKSEWADVYIVNWDLLRLPKINSERKYFSTDLYYALTGRKWFHVVIDEAQRCKNRASQQTKVLKRIKTAYKTALTGTPIANRPPDLWSILNWLYPKDFSSYWKWYARYSVSHFDYRGTTKYHVYDGPKNTGELQQRIRKFTVQRGREVRPQLPPRHVELMVDLDPKQRRAYETMRKHMVAWVGEQEDTPLIASAVVAKLQRLQMLAIAHADIAEDGSVTMIEPSSKLDEVMTLLEDNPDEQFVIFSQFRGTVELLSTRLQHVGISYGRIIGGQSADERRSAIYAFSAGKSRVIVGTIAAGGEGIDGLQCASALVFIDRDWSPARNDQAIGRIDRLGQQGHAVVYDIIARNSVDQYKGQLLNRKAAWIKEMLS